MRNQEVGGHSWGKFLMTTLFLHPTAVIAIFSFYGEEITKGFHFRKQQQQQKKQLDKPAQTKYLSNLTKTTTNTQTAMLSRARNFYKSKQQSSRKNCQRVNFQKRNVNAILREYH